MPDAAQPDAAELFYGLPLNFNEKQHRYEWDGKLVPGVTSILRRLNKPALIQWAADMACQHVIANATQAEGKLVIDPDVMDDARRAHASFRDAAADTGKSVHLYAEEILRGLEPDLPDDPAARKAIGGFYDWLDQHEIEPIHLEKRVFSKRFYYAGTTDFFGRIDGRLSVLDFKTSSAIYDEMWLQTTAYEIALKEQLQFNEDLDRWIVRLDKKTGKFEAVRQEFSAAHEDAWLHLVELNKILSHIERQRKDQNGIRTRKRRAA